MTTATILHATAPPPKADTAVGVVLGPPVMPRMLSAKDADKRRRLRAEIARLDRELVGIDHKRDVLESWKMLAGRLSAWLKSPLRLEKPDGCSLHKLIEAIENDDVLYLDRVKRTDQMRHEASAALRDDMHTFVVTHDWAAALNGADDYADGEFCLPYEACCYEFKISGVRVIAMIEQCHDIQMTLIFFNGFWTVDNDVYVIERDGWRLKSGAAKESISTAAIADILHGQIKAISVALEAEVAVTETVRAPHRLNRAREKAGREPLKDYHVVSLARRSRPIPLPSHDHTGKRRRLHFRRGHWRHYQTHKTWIRWMLVGDPDLGFIEKHYRL